MESEKKEKCAKENNCVSADENIRIRCIIGDGCSNCGCRCSITISLFIIVLLLCLSPVFDKIGKIVCGTQCIQWDFFEFYIFVSTVFAIALFSLVVLKGLDYWFKLGMTREQRLSKKEGHDFFVRKMECYRDLVNGSTKKDGTHRYEITIGPKTEKTQEQDLTPKA